MSYQRELPYRRELMSRRELTYRYELMSRRELTYRRELMSRRKWVSVPVVRFFDVKLETLMRPLIALTVGVAVLCATALTVGASSAVADTTDPHEPVAIPGLQASSFTLSQDGTRFYMPAPDAKVNVLDIATNTLLKPLSAPGVGETTAEGPFSGRAFSETSGHLYFDTGGSLRSVKVDAGTVPTQLMRFMWLDFALSPDGKILYTSAWDYGGEGEYGLTLFDTEDDSVISYRPSTTNFQRLAVSPTGGEVYAISNTMVEVLRGDTGEPVRSFAISMDGNVNDAIVSPDGKLLYLVDKDFDIDVTVVDIARGEVVDVIPAHGTASVSLSQHQLSFSPTGDRLFVATPSGLTAIDTASRKVAAIFSAPTASDSATTFPAFVAVSPDGGHAYASFHDSVYLVKAPKFSDAGLPVAVVGQPYDAQLPLASGTKSFTYTATGLPEGLTLDAATGRVSGTPTVAQAGAPVTFSVSNLLGTDTTEMSFAVQPAEDDGGNGGNGGNGGGSGDSGNAGANGNGAIANANAHRADAHSGSRSGSANDGAGDGAANDSAGNGAANDSTGNGAASDGAGDGRSDAAANCGGIVSLTGGEDPVLVGIAAASAAGLLAAGIMLLVVLRRSRRTQDSDEVTNR